MYHLCVQEISIRTREERDLGPVEPLDGGRGRTRDALPVIEVIGALEVRYQRRIVYMSYSIAFNKMRFHKSAFPRNAGKAR